MGLTSVIREGINIQLSSSHEERFWTEVTASIRTYIFIWVFSHGVGEHDIRCTGDVENHSLIVWSNVFIRLDFELCVARE